MTNEPTFMTGSDKVVPPAKRKVRSLPLGIAFGLAMGLLFAYLVAAMQGKYYFEIMLPGAILGVIVGFATYQYGDARRTAAA